MRLERRILLLIILSVLLPALVGNYGRLVMETRMKLRSEGERGLSFARYVVTSAAPQRGTLDMDNVARFRQEHGMLTAELVGRDGVVRAATEPERVGLATGFPAEAQRALAGEAVSRIIVAPSLDDANGRTVTLLDYLLLRPYREQTAHELWIAVPNAAGGDPALVLHSRTGLDRATGALAASYKLQIGVVWCVIGLVALALRLALARWIERPLAELGRVAARIADGDRAARAPVGPDDAIGRLNRTFNAMHDALVAKEREAELDSVVGLLNHRALHRALDREVAQAEARGGALAVLMLDLDGFKGVNDTWGHQVGDRVLQEVGELLLRHTRRSDIVGRYGGDEFMVILPGTGRDGAHELIERLRGAVRALTLPDLRRDPMLDGVSIGCAVYAEDATTPAELIARADARLYAMKEAGREAPVVAGR
jgi:diguanylate cyclase (GGDEF)-like protein